MILYFSGTGNSAYVARRIGAAVGDETVDLFERLRDGDVSELTSDRPFVVVCPTYAWRIPRMVQRWLEHTPLTGNDAVYFVMTCGDSIGNAPAYLKKLCQAKRMTYMGCSEIVMPENYIAMFTTPDGEEAARIIAAAEPKIDQAAEAIAAGKPLPQRTASLVGRLCSGIVNDVFYPVFVSAKKFRVAEDCVGCGRCAVVCPMKNVVIKDGRPVWGDSCTHCMACICRCPQEAIEYGSHSKGLPRYVCPKEAR